MIKYKDTNPATNTLQTPKKGQIKRKAKPSFADVIEFIATALLLGVLFLILTN